MALDPSIPLQGRGVNLGATIQQALSTGLGVLQLKQGIEAGRSREAVRNAFAQFGGDPAALSKALYAADPGVGMAYETKQAQLGQARASLDEAQAKQQERTARWAKTATDDLLQRYTRTLKTTGSPVEAEDALRAGAHDYGEDAVRYFGKEQAARILSEPGQITLTNVQQLNKSAGTYLASLHAAKAPAPFTLKPGDQRFGYDAEGKPVVVAEVAAPQGEFKAPKEVTMQAPGGRRGTQSIVLDSQESVDRMKALTERGWTITSQRLQGTPADFTQKTQSEVQGEIKKADDQIARITEIQRTFKPEYLEMPTQWAMSGLATLEKAGIDIGKEQRSTLTEYKNWQASAATNLNKYIKETTGAQMSEAEVSRLRKAAPDPEHDSPTEFKAKMDTVIAIAQRARDRYVNLLQEGLVKPGERISDDLAKARPVDMRLAKERRKGGAAVEETFKAPSGRVFTIVPKR